MRITRRVFVPAAVSFPVLSGRGFTIRIAAVRNVLTHEWYCECDQVMPAGIAELGIPDLEPVRVATAIPSECRNDLVRVDGRPRQLGTLRSEPDRNKAATTRV